MEVWGVAALHTLGPEVVSVRPSPRVGGEFRFSSLLGQFQSPPARPVALIQKPLTP